MSDDEPSELDKPEWASFHQLMFDQLRDVARQSQYGHPPDTFTGVVRLCNGAEPSGQDLLLPWINDGKNEITARFLTVLLLVKPRVLVLSACCNEILVGLLMLPDGQLKAGAVRRLSLDKLKEFVATGRQGGLTTIMPDTEARTYLDKVIPLIPRWEQVPDYPSSGLTLGEAESLVHSALSDKGEDERYFAVAGDGELSTLRRIVAHNPIFPWMIGPINNDFSSLLLAGGARWIAMTLMTPEGFAAILCEAISHLQMEPRSVWLRAGRRWTQLAPESAAEIAERIQQLQFQQGEVGES